MPIVRVANRSTEFAYDQNVPLLTAALAAEQPWRRFCGASALCGTCSVVVIEGNLAPPRPREQMFIDAWGRHPQYRLACQARLTGTDVTVVNCADAGFDADKIQAACEAAQSRTEVNP